MIWLPRPFLYHRQVDPREARIESGAPDHVGNFGTSSVCELGLSVLGPGDPRNPYYARFGQVLWLHPEQGLTGGHQLGPGPSSDRRAGGEHSVEDDPSYERHENPRRHALWTEWEVAGAGSGQPHIVGSSQLFGDLCPRVAGSDHKDTSFLELTGVAVLGDMKLDYARIELAGEVRDTGFLPARHRNHHVVGLKPSVSGSRHEEVALSRESLHPYTGLDANIEAPGVRLQIVGHLVFAREPPMISGKRHPGEPVEPIRGEQPQRVPALTPGCTWPVIVIDDRIREAPP